MKAKIYQKILLIAFAFVLVIPSVALADDLEDKINELKNKIAQNQSAVNQKRKEADTLQNKISILSGQISLSQQALNLTKEEIRKLEQEISKANEELNHQKDLLRANVKLIYKRGETSEMELLASSDNLSDFVGRQQSMQNIKDKINQNLAKINELKRKLEDDNQKLSIKFAEQKAQNDSLNQQSQEQSGLLAQTKGEEANYQRIVGESNKALQGVYAERAKRDAARGIGVSVGGSGGYPWAYPASFTSESDPWRFFKRQCVSYAAWWRYAHGRTPQPNGWGNATDWASRGSTSPTVGSVVVWPAYSEPGIGSAGHVAIVESVSGNTMSVSEYNWRPFQYSYRTNVPIGGYMRFIH